jgi:hypothetical protein
MKNLSEYLKEDLFATSANTIGAENPVICDVDIEGSGDVPVTKPKTKSKKKLRNKLKKSIEDKIDSNSS